MKHACRALHNDRADANLLHMHQTPSLIGATEAARTLDVDKSTLTRWVASGRVPIMGRMPKANGALIFDRAVIDALAAQLRAGRAAAAERVLAGDGAPEYDQAVSA